MKALPLKRGEGPYEMSHPLENEQTKQMEDRVFLFNVRPYGEQEGKPTAFLISEHPRNASGDISVVTPRIAQKLWQSHRYQDIEGLTFILHYPENVRENGPERYDKVEIKYTGNGPYIKHTSKNLAPDKVAEIIGQENMQEKYLPAPRKSANPLVMKAFESGMADKPEHQQSNEPTIEL